MTRASCTDRVTSYRLAARSRTRLIQAASTSPALEAACSYRMDSTKKV